MTKLSYCFLITAGIFIHTTLWSKEKYTIKETPESLKASTSNYEISFKKTGFRFWISYKGATVLASESTCPFFFTKDSTTYKINKFTSFERVGDTLFLKCATTYKNDPAILAITFFTDHFSIGLKTKETYEKMGYNIQVKPQDRWYGGAITSSQLWPANSASFEVDPFNASWNQASPIWYSSKGVGIFLKSYEILGYSFNKPIEHNFSFHAKNINHLNVYFTMGTTVTDAYKTLINLVGKPQITPPKRYFTDPIFNSWIEFKTNVNQAGLIQYATKIREQQFPCTVLEIDDMWTPAYGEFEFDKTKFPNAKELIDALQANGFKVGLWVTPFVHKNAATYDYLVSKKYLVQDKTGKAPYFVDWWNGHAAMIDLSNPQAYQWFLDQLKNLQAKYGINGFKLDAGDAYFLDNPHTTYGNITPNQYADLFAGIGKNFEINELRVSWLTQSMGLVQRLRDKKSSWSKENGIGSIIPHGLTEGLIGYPYFCPDMIGGGEIGSFMENKDQVDHELFIRWTEASALMPMMQYSYAPWKIDSLTTSIGQKYAKLHQQFGEYIYSLAQEAVQTGAPIMRSLFYQYPTDTATYAISDQFMLGDRYLVAPVLIKSSTQRDIYLPEGTWIDYWDGTTYKGGQTIRGYEVPLDKLPIFKCVNKPVTTYE